MQNSARHYSIAILDSNVDRSHEVARMVGIADEGNGACEVSLYTDLAELREDVRYKQLDILIVEARYPWDDSGSISLVRQHVICSEMTRVIFIDGSPSATPEVYAVPHVYLLPSCPTEDQVIEALSFAKRSLNEYLETPLFIRTKGVEQTVYPEMIRYVESNARTLTLHLTGGNLRTYGKLSEILRCLPQYFCQCHKSFVVNTRFVSALGSDYVELSTGEHIPVSQKRKQHTREVLHRYRRVPFDN